MTAVTRTRPAPENPYARIYAEFLEQTKDHVLTVTVDDGLNRQMHVGAPGTNIWSFGVVTWPNYLVTVGDIADGFVFSRINDMLDFFDCRGSEGYYSDGASCIDAAYWAQKLVGSRDVRHYSEAAFLASVKDHLRDHEDIGDDAQAEYEKIVAIARTVCARNGVDFEEYLTELRSSGAAPNLELAADAEELEYFGLPIPEQTPASRAASILADAAFHRDTEQEARDWLSDSEGVELFGPDTWEWDLRELDVHFLYTCFALELTVRLWREYETTPAAVERRDPSRAYVLVEGGVVQNAPLLPVYDMDLLKEQDSVEAAHEALELYERIIKHSEAKQSLPRELKDLAAMVRAGGCAEDVQALNKYESTKTKGRAA
ncbi:hypothetical protein SAMN06295974_3865 [Plantibacter flavus]|uniref:Uncharacterized protein n=1 Tax=Plantibacter flavus TaxID=150123 RepID=A0A3N2BL45_9MICO|nr:hypothetical protein [Plantibacter flavus]ROR75990.1 hypothetical protein EDD42_3941 [Plantibacter flavus]SMG49568.1 hypothetical protein SAMN06295974_3865 [Plantibacter flavus]